MRFAIFSVRYSMACVFLILFAINSTSLGGIVVKGFQQATEPTGNELNNDGAFIEPSINGNGLIGDPDPQYTYDAPITSQSHFEVTLANSWMYEYATTSPTPIDVILELQPSSVIGGTWVDAFCLWNLNKGDARRAALDDTGGYLEEQFWGITGVEKATLFYSSDDAMNWTEIGLLDDFEREETDRSTIQVRPFSPVQATHFKLTLTSAFGLTRNFDDTGDRYRIGFAEVAYREYIPPAPPVVPEPGSVAVFGGLMAVGGLMRWRRQRSVGS